MKLALGILIVLVVAVGVWVSLSVGRIEPPQQQETEQTATTTTQGWQAYNNTMYGFSARYPQGYSVAEPYTYQALGPGKDIAGVKFVVPAAATVGTNLAGDSGISVEYRPGAVNSCSAEIYLTNPTHEGFVDDGARRYSVARSAEAAAGNRYEERVYATPTDGGCVGIRYFLHYGAIENYPQGSVREFDRQALTAQFDAIRKSVVLK